MKTKEGDKATRGYGKGKVKIADTSGAKKMKAAIRTAVAAISRFGSKIK